MTKTITVKLDTVYKQGAVESEYRYMNRYSITDEGKYYEIISDYPRLRKLLKMYYEQEGHKSVLVEVVRGSTTCWTKAPIESWIMPTDRRPEWLRRPTP